MLQRVSMTAMKVRPTDRKVRKSIYTAQKTVEEYKQTSSVEVKPFMTGLSNTLKFIKNNIIKKTN